MTVFEAYITNLGKYAEGQLVGETLKFPATTEEVQSLLKNIGVDGVRYEEFFITAFDGDVMGLYDYLTEYENLDELNHLAHLISELDSDEIETLDLGRRLRVEKVAFATFSTRWAGERVAPPAALSAHIPGNPPGRYVIPFHFSQKGRKHSGRWKSGAGVPMR